MATYTAPGAFDAALNYIAQATRLSLVSEIPTSYAGLESVRLASASLSPGDFSISDGDNGARVLTVAEKTDAGIIAGGTGTHFVLDGGGEIKHGAPCEPIEVTAFGENKVDFPSWSTEIRVRTGD